MQKYRKKGGQFVVAVRLNLDTAGFTYQKWGGTQRCKAGDWVVDNDGEVYTIDADEFEKSYSRTGAGTFAKDAAVWAERANTGGRLETISGEQSYCSGVYLVSNSEDRANVYSIEQRTFEKMYELND